MTARFLTVIVLVLGLAACQHAQPEGPVYRINRVIVEPAGGSYDRVAAAQLRAKLRAVANDINRQIGPGVPGQDLVVRLEPVKYAAPAGPFLLGRSRIKGTMQAGPWHYTFRGSDDGTPGLGEAFDIEGYYSPERSFARISRGIANKFSVKYARTFGIEKTSWETLSQATPATTGTYGRTGYGQSGGVAPPPLTLVGGGSRLPPY